MKESTREQINEIARLMYNEVNVTRHATKDVKFYANDSFTRKKYWNMALIAYVHCFPKHRDLLRFKL